MNNTLDPVSFLDLVGIVGTSVDSTATLSTATSSSKTREVGVIVGMNASPGGRRLDRVSLISNAWKITPSILIRAIYMAGQLTR